MDSAQFEEKVVTKGGKQELKEFNYEELCRVVNSVAKEVYGTKPSGERKAEREKRKQEIKIKWRDVSTAEPGQIAVKLEESQPTEAPAEEPQPGPSQKEQEELEKVIEDIERHEAEEALQEEEIPVLLTPDTMIACLEASNRSLTLLCQRQEAFIEGLIMGHAMCVGGVIAIYLLMKLLR